MKDNFERCLELVLKHEGGYVNHKKDPGGRTNLGVTQRVYEQWVGRRVEEAEMKALTLEIVAPLYRRNYWHAIGGNMLPAGIDYCVFDAAVNSGPRQAVKWLQRALGAFDDGVVGVNTIAKVLVKPSQDIIREVCTQRIAFLQKLPTWSTFGKGWARRVEEVETDSLAMAVPYDAPEQTKESVE